MYNYFKNVLQGDTMSRSWIGERKATFLKRNLRVFRQQSQRNNNLPPTTKSILTTAEPVASCSSSSTSAAAAVETISEDTIEAGGSEKVGGIQVEEEEEDDGMNLESEIIEKCLPQRITNAVTGDFVVDDKTQCKFNINSFKMVYIVNRESYLYKKDAFLKAREVRHI